MSLVLSAANVIVCIIGAANSATLLGGAEKAVSGGSSLSELIKRLSSKESTHALNTRIARDLEHEMANQHLSDTQRLLVPQMIVARPLTPAEIMAAARNPALICDAMLSKLTDPAHCAPAAQDGFRRVVTPTLTKLLGDVAIADTLRPAFESAVAESLAYIGEQVEQLAAQFRDTAYQLGAQETLVRELARRYAPGSDGDFRQACLGIENALQTFEKMRAQNALPHTAADQVDAVLARVDALNKAAEFDAADAALAAARAEAREQIAEQTSGLMRLLDSSVTQALLRNLPQEAAEALVERLSLDDPPDEFVALIELQKEWLVRGRDKGLAFDLQVSIALGKTCVAQAKSVDHRVTALINLGLALFILGEREPVTARLEEAVAIYTEVLDKIIDGRLWLDRSGALMNRGIAQFIIGERQNGTALTEAAVKDYSEALTERLHKNAPSVWAMVQLNLGNALSAIGQHDRDTVRLHAATVAYSEAQKISTRDRDPFNWGKAQHGLAVNVKIHGDRERSPARLKEAVAAHTEALAVRTRDREPLEWAMSQTSLGDALTSLGKLEVGTARLEGAVAAYTEALKERTRDRVQLNWATSWGNQGEAMRVLADRTNDLGLATTALRQITEAEAQMRAGGHIPNADYYASRLPDAQALVARLTS